MHLPDRRVERLKKEHCAGGPEISSFYWESVNMGVFSPAKL
jgi:hypothetical protein